MTSRMTLTAAALALGTLGLCSTADGDIIEARFDTVSSGQAVSFSSNAGHKYSSAMAGGYTWTRTGGDYAGEGAAGQFVTFCIEVAQHISYNKTYSFTLREPEDSPRPGVGMGTEKADLLAELFGRYFGSLSTTTDYTAFQTAVWEVTHDDDRSLAAGNFRVKDTGSFFSLSQSWLDTLDGSGPMADLAVMSSNSAQDQVFLVPGPGSLAGLTLLLVGAGGRRRRTA